MRQMMVTLSLFLGHFAQRVCVLGLLVIRVLAEIFLRKILVIFSSKLLHIWQMIKEMGGNFTEKWNEGGKLLNAIFFSTLSLYFYKSVYNLFSRSGQVDHLTRKRFLFHKRNFFKHSAFWLRKLFCWLCKGHILKDATL